MLPGFLFDYASRRWSRAGLVDVVGSGQVARERDDVRGRRISGAVQADDTGASARKRVGMRAAHASQAPVITTTRSSK